MMFTNEFPLLFSPIQVGKLRLKNRIVMPPMGNRYPTYYGEVTPRLIQYYVERARGGVGLIVVQFANVTSTGQSSLYPLGIWHDNQINGLKNLARGIKAEGVPVAIQLAHVGAMGESSITGIQPVGPSPIPCFRREIPRELNINEIHDLVEDFAQAARRVVEAGFDAVELHMAHGYLLQQFLSPLSNRRNDEYGRNIDGRLRFPLEVLGRVREIVGISFPIICRVCVDEVLPGGISIDDGIYIARALEESGADIISVTGGRAETFHIGVPSEIFPHDLLLKMAAAVKKNISIPVIAVGKLHEPLIMERALAEGYADLIAVGRGLIADPELPRKAKEGRMKDIRPCLVCSSPECHGRIFKQLSMGCVVNPIVGREEDFALRPTDRIHKVLVVGGGPGGLEAARVAALRGHHVILYEKAPTLGGQFLFASKAPHKHLLMSLIEYYEKQLSALNVEIHLKSEIDAGNVKVINPDDVIVATGAKPKILEIPGLAHRAITAWDVLAGSPVGNSVAVIGGGVVGCNVAEYLAERHHDVTILEMLPYVARELVSWTRRLYIESLKSYKIEILLQCLVLEVDGNNLIYDQVGYRKILHSVDSVVLASGALPNNLLLANLLELGIKAIAVGDCVKPRNAGEAIREGYEAGLKI